MSDLKGMLSPEIVGCPVESKVVGMSFRTRETLACLPSNILYNHHHVLQRFVGIAITGSSQLVLLLGRCSYVDVNWVFVGNFFEPH